jgi:glutathione S-transferase
VSLKLYVIPASHPSTTAELMLKRKGIDYKRRDLVTAMHIPMLKAMRFPSRTVPAIKTDDGRKIQGTREISRFLDELQPDPPLFPADTRAAVEEAERWGDEELQSVPRRLSYFALARDRSQLKGFMEGYKLGFPPSVAAATAGPIIKAELKIQNASDDAVRTDLDRLPELLDHVDDLIAQGVIGGDEPNAADFQIAPSVRLLMAFDQLRPLIEARPAGAWAEKIAPDPGGRFPTGLPPEWIPVSPAPAAPSSDPQS